MQLEILDVNPNWTDQCWMRITADGKSTEMTLSEGQTQSVKAAEKINLNLGNAGVVKITPVSYTHLYMAVPTCNKRSNA